MPSFEKDVRKILIDYGCAFHRFMRLMVAGWWVMTRKRVLVVRAISSIMARKRFTPYRNAS